MHYIRFLKSPKLVTSGREQCLEAKITVTTDLGEAFLAADVEIFVSVVGANGSVVGAGKTHAWKGSEGMRSLGVSVGLKGRKDVVRMCVSASGDAAVESFQSVLRGGKGGVVTVRSMGIDTRTGKSIGSGMAERVFTFGSGKEVHIWEETGESIARHIWYVPSGTSSSH